MHVSDADRSLLQFDLASIPNGASVSNAQLVLCFASIAPSAAGRTHELNRPTSGWTETTVTWNNQPGGNSGQAVTWTIPSIPGCVSLDVTSSLQAWVGGTANNGWRITDEDEGTAQHVEYVTREDPVSGLRPTLNVTYAP
jgi:hypothetical protein